MLLSKGKEKIYTDGPKTKHKHRGSRQEQKQTPTLRKPNNEDKKTKQKQKNKKKVSTEYNSIEPYKPNMIHTKRKEREIKKNRCRLTSSHSRLKNIYIYTNYNKTITYMNKSN